VRFLTRHELAEALNVSLRTVDTMLASGEIPHLRLHGNFIRFYLPDVVRHLTASDRSNWQGVRPGTGGEVLACVAIGCRCGARRDFQMCLLR